MREVEREVEKEVCQIREREVGEGRKRERESRERGILVCPEKIVIAFYPLKRVDNK